MARIGHKKSLAGSGRCCFGVSSNPERVGGLVSSQAPGGPTATRELESLFPCPHSIRAQLPASIAPGEESLLRDQAPGTQGWYRTAALGCGGCQGWARSVGEEEARGSGPRLGSMLPGFGGISQALEGPF